MDVTRSKTRRRARMGAIGLVLALALGSVTALPAQAAARPAAKDRVILFVHGWVEFGKGASCSGSFAALKTSLRSAGFTGAMVGVGFYDSDRNCDVNLRSWDSSITNGSSWKTLSKALSKYIYETYTKKGITVDLVGHSMGGLIIRGAVKGSADRDAGFSLPLKVEDAVTLGSPHNGAAWYTTFCLWGQCSGLKPGASEINWVRTNANPQGVGGTDWTVMGSSNDIVVPVGSAVSMGVPDGRKVRYSSLSHTAYVGDATCQARTAKALAEADA